MTTGRRRFWVLLFSGLAILAMVFLAAGLSDLQFLPGHPLPRRAESDDLLGGFFRPFPGSEILGYLFLAFYYVALLLLPVAIVYFIISPDMRRRVIRGLGLLLWLVAILMMIRARPDLFQELQLVPEAAPQAGDTAIPEVEFGASIPAWLETVATLGLAVATAAALVGVGWYVWRRSQRPASALEQLAMEAQVALDALEAGAGVHDTVMRCYFEMSRALGENRGLRRGEAVTPREFESELKGAGLPTAQIEQLTRLFEAVRYGARIADEVEERQAVACLTAIVEAAKR
jgi:uncharacterized membrane protein YhaH (DUF805 family)